MFVPTLTEEDLDLIERRRPILMEMFTAEKLAGMYQIAKIANRQLEEKVKKLENYIANLEEQLD